MSSLKSMITWKAIKNQQWSIWSSFIACILFCSAITQNNLSKRLLCSLKNLNSCFSWTHPNQKFYYIFCRVLPILVNSCLEREVLLTSQNVIFTYLRSIFSLEQKKVIHINVVKSCSSHSVINTCLKVSMLHNLSFPNLFSFLWLEISQKWFY